MGPLFSFDFDTPELLKALEDFSEQILSGTSKVASLEEVLAAEEHCSSALQDPAPMDTSEPEATRLSLDDAETIKEESTYYGTIESDLGFQSPVASPQNPTAHKIGVYTASYTGTGRLTKSKQILLENSYDMYQPWSSPESVNESDDLFPELNF